MLYFACVFSMGALLAAVLYLRTEKEQLLHLARSATALSVLAVALAVIRLSTAFIRNDFSFAYVAANSARSLPVIYKLSALWAGQSGSLLLWLFLISLLALLVQGLRAYWREQLDLKLNLVLNLVRLLFILLLLFVTSPFVRLAQPPFDGAGLNPMLQSPGMVIHPPLLFLGFSGFLLPFALAVIGLWQGEQQAAWQEQSRVWTLVSWGFLTAGIVTGGNWAYSELGWGGYWAWDPVENASLLPWLTSGALLHTLMLPRGCAGRRIWNFGLIVLTFLLTIFGTYLTRSGVLDSVHAFAGGVLGQVFFLVLLGALLFSIILAIKRRPLLTEEVSPPPARGHSTSALLLQLSAALFVLLAAAVFLGTMFPLFSRLFLAREIVLDPSFFNQLSAPLFLAILGLVGLMPALGAGKIPWGPLLVALATALYCRLVLGAGLMVLLGFTVSAFGLAGQLQVLFRRPRLRQIGGALVHLGVLIVAIGVIGSTAFVDELFISVQPGQTVRFSDYTLEYSGLQTRYAVDHYSVGATLEVSRRDRPVGELHSRKVFWENSRQPSTEVGILSGFREDLYLNLAGWEGQEALLHLQRFALVRWIWLGSGLIYLGVLVALGGALRHG